MRRESKRKTWTIDKGGQLVFSTRGRVNKKHSKSDVMLKHPAVVFIVAICCALLDFIMFKQLFGSFLYDKIWIQWLSIIGLLIGFDLAPIYLGVELKSLKQGLNANKLVVFILFIAFIIAFGFNVFLRIVMKDQVLPDLQAMTTSIFGDVNMGIPENEKALPYALFAAFLPLVTSLVSFGISYSAFNPLRQRMRRLREEQILLERDIDTISATLVEYNEDNSFLERITDDDERNYFIAREMIREKAFGYADYVRERFAEYIGSPSAAYSMAVDQHALLEQLFDTTINKRPNKDNTILMHNSSEKSNGQFEKEKELKTVAQTMKYLGTA